MNKNYQTKDILSAIDILLNNKEKKVLKLVSQVEDPLILKMKPRDQQKKSIVYQKIQKKLFCKQKNI